jgi:hypothetical protein
VRTNAMLLAALVAVTAVSSSARAAWLNETGLPREADYAVLRSSSLNVSAGTLSLRVYGQINEAGMTEWWGPNEQILADVGYGPLASDPRSNDSWVWFPAMNGLQLGNNDEYWGRISSPMVNGAYSFTFRFSLDDRGNFTAADLDGAGSNPGLTFDQGSLGLMTVTGGIVPETDPAPLLLLSFGIWAVCASVEQIGRARVGERRAASIQAS